MNNGRFRIYLRRRQNISVYPLPDGPTVNVIVQCAPLTGYAEYVPGDVDNVTPFAGIIPVSGWYDFTDFIEPDGINKLSFTWDKVNSGDSNNSTTSEDGSNYDKGITSDLTFFDSGYQFVYNWLILTECQILNCVEVKIVDLIARSLNPDPSGNYRLFEIKNDNLEYAPVDAPCQFQIKLREQDNNWHCIHKNFIWDNWQHWFEDSGVKTHPCFLTCIEPRPRLVQSARMALLLFFHSLPATVIIDWITGAPSIEEHARKVLNANRFVDAPLVRTYIENIAGKCGLLMDTIFDTGKDWERLCLYFPQAGYMHESDDDAAVSPSLSYHFDNRWLITIADLLDKLKIVFAAEWYVTPLNTIVFKYTKDLINLLPIYDFTLPDSVPIYGLRYTFNGDKKPAYGSYQYSDDGSDLASQEMSTLYSDIIDYDGPANNPMLEGEKVKNFEFAPTGFVRDGRSKDYMKLLIEDGKFGALIITAILAIIVAALTGGIVTIISGGVLTILIFLTVGDLLLKTTALKNEFVDGPTYTGAVRLTSEQTLTPRLILWDGLSEQRAKVETRVGLPVPNPFYNPALVPYNVKNQVQEDNPSAIIYNYPLYIDGDFYGNLYSKYHDPIDNPLKSLETHQDATFYLDLCEEMLNLFGVFQNQYAVIGKILKIESRNGYDVYIRIGNFSVDYDGEKITVKGTVIRRNQAQVDTENPGNIPVVTPEDSGGGGLPGPTDTCLKWKNNGDTDATVTYFDCLGAMVSDVVFAPGATFCALEIVSISGGNIQATDTCGEESGSGSGTSICYSWQNIGIKDAINVSYIDCDGNPVDNVTIPSQTDFCAQSIVDYGTCGLIVNVGACEVCNPPPPPIIYSVTEDVIVQYDASDFGFFLIFASTGQTGNVDWGDGSPLEPFTNGGTLGVLVTHNYATAGNYTPIVYPDNNTLKRYGNDGVPITGDVWITTSFTHSSTLTSLDEINLAAIGVGTISFVLPPAYSNITQVSYIGSPDGGEITYDFATLNAAIVDVELTAFVNLSTVVNLPSTVTKKFGFSNNPNLSDINSSGVMPIAETQAIILNNNPTVGTIDLSICKAFSYREQLTSGEIDTFLIALDANGLLNGTCDVRQGTPTSPGGSGLTAKANLIGKGWTVTTD